MKFIDSKVSNEKVIFRSSQRAYFRKDLFFSSRSTFFWSFPGDLMCSPKETNFPRRYVCSPNRYHFSMSYVYVFTEQILRKQSSRPIAEICSEEGASRKLLICSMIFKKGSSGKSLSVLLSKRCSLEISLDTLLS